MNINILDYLTENEIKEICRAEIRIKIKNSFREPDMARIISNSAYYKAYDLIDEHITEEHKEKIINKVNEIIDSKASYNIFRYNVLNNVAESYAAKLLETTVKNREVDIVESINNFIDKTINSDDEEYESLINKLIENMWSGFSIKFNKAF